MVLKYLIPQVGQPLLQGEILGNVWEHRPIYPSIEPPIEKANTQPSEYIKLHSIRHEFVIVMNPVCDLNQDFVRSRFPEGQFTEQSKDPDGSEFQQHLIPYLLLGDMYTDSIVIRKRFFNRALWDRVEKNLDERYHYLEPASVGEPVITGLPGLYLDFKKVTGIPSVSVYEGIRQGKIERIAVLPPIYVHNLIHRFYSFLSRVGIP